MFESWKIECFQPSEYKSSRYFTLKKLDKIHLLSKAQQRLVTTVSSSLNELTVTIPNHISKYVDPENAITGCYILIPTLKSQTNLKDSFKITDKFNRWIPEKYNIKIDSKLKELKVLNLKETIKFSKHSKSKIESCLKSSIHNFEKEAIPKDKPNNYLLWITDLSLKSTKNLLENQNQKWKPTVEFNPEAVLDEPSKKTSILQELVFQKENLRDIGNPFFITDYLQNEIILPTISNKFSNYTKFMETSSTLLKWKCKNSVSWVINKTIFENIVNEPIKKIEIKYKIPINSIEFPNSYNINKTTFCSSHEKWNFSKYTMYMLTWKPFEGLKLEGALEEDLNLNDTIVLISMLDDDNDEKYIKLAELENKRTQSLNEKLVSFPIKEDNGLQHSGECAQVLDYNEVHDYNFVDRATNSDTQIELKTVNQNSIIYSSVDVEKSDNEDHSASCTSIVDLEHQPTTSLVTSPKRTFSELDSLILKKKKRNTSTQFDFAKKYPYLDILNQTTLLSQMALPETRAETKSQSFDTSIEEPDQIPVATNQANNQILEESLLFDNELNLSIPGNKICNIMINIKFPSKFGRAFHRFSNIVEQSYERLIINEFEMNNTLEFDMFLNVTCGVLFFRPINIYQIDINTGENLVFEQLAEVAMQVFSLIVVIVVDDTADLENDKKLSTFITQAMEFGIEIVTLANEAKTISKGLFELIQKYGIIESDPFQWTSDHQFLENCGIVNPFLSNWILSNWSLETFISMSETERTDSLHTVCTVELIEGLNRAVSEYCRNKKFS